MSAAFPSSWRILFGLLFIYLFAQSRALELPVGPPLPAPTYMVNNQGNTHHAAPDKGTQNGPVLPPAASHSNSTGGPHGKKLATRSTSYWLANMVHGQVLHPQLLQIRLLSLHETLLTKAISSPRCHMLRAAIQSGGT
jgi:hypothetical protein